MMHKYKLNMKILGKKVGDVINVEVDRDGTPLDIKIREYWQFRNNDNCMELVSEKKTERKVKEDVSTRD